MSKDRYERKHRRTHRHLEAVAFMASANFNRVEPLYVAMGLTEMTAHTPGPWKFWDRKDDHANHLITDAKGIRGIARPITMILPQSLQPDEMRANARLIAAAPEMLEALRKVAAMFQEAQLRTGLTDYLRETWEDVDAAIAKAEGR